MLYTFSMNIESIGQLAQPKISVQKTSVEILSGKDQEPCQHHWILPAPEGPTSLGICNNCHVQKVFPNSIGNLLDERGKDYNRTPSKLYIEARYAGVSIEDWVAQEFHS